MIASDHLRQFSSRIAETVIGYRRHLHTHPELSFEEEKTAAFIAAELTALDIPFQTGVAGHGVVALIEGEKGPSNHVVALRADMDALPITEANEVPYRSVQPGVMHACGHDAHSASLLGVAHLLSAAKKDFSGTVKLIFQPAEEKAPGGASLMIRDGVLESPKVHAIYGQHVQPFLDTGKIGIRSGQYMASADEIYLTIVGKGGHGAMPHLFTDPIAIGAQIITALQQVVSRSDPRIPTILSFGKFIGNGATNIIPESVYIEGTLRTFNEEWREKALQKVHSIATSVAEGFGARAEVNIQRGYPVLHNDEALTARSRPWIEAFVGKEQVVDLDLWMAAEDFAWYTHHVPGCFYRIGTRNEAKGIVHGLHTPRFDLDEEALRLAPGLMAWLAIRELNHFSY